MGTTIHIGIRSIFITSSPSVPAPTWKRLGMSLEKLWGYSNLKIIWKDELVHQRNLYFSVF